jgi:WD40 repeat protein
MPSRLPRVALTATFSDAKGLRTPFVTCPDAVFAVAWNAASPTIVASGSADDTVYLFQVCMPESYALDLFTSLLLRSLRPVPGAYAPQAGGTTEQRLEGHTDTVACLAFSSDGSMLASGGLDGDTPPVHALTFMI